MGLMVSALRTFRHIALHPFMMVQRSDGEHRHEHRQEYPCRRLSICVSITQNGTNIAIFLKVDGQAEKGAAGGGVCGRLSTHLL